MRPMSLRSMTVIRPKNPISRLTSTRALISVRMKPSGTGSLRLHGAGPAAAGAGPRDPHDAAEQRARQPRRPAHGLPVEAHPHLLARSDAEPAGVLDVQQDVRSPLEGELRRVL